MPFKYILSLLFVAFAFVPGLPIAYFSAQYFKAEVHQSYLANLAAIADLEAENVSGFFRNVHRRLGALERMPEVQMLLQEPDLSRHSPTYAKYRQTLSNYLKLRTNLLENVNYLALLTPAGTVIASSDAHDTGRNAEFDLSRYSLQKGTYIVTPLCSLRYSSASDRHFSIIEPIFINNALTGILVATHNLRPFKHLLRRPPRSASGTLFLTDGDGALIGSSDGDDSRQDADLATFRQQVRLLDLAAQPAGLIRYTSNGEERLASYQAVPETGWLLFNAIDVSEIQNAWGRYIRMLCAVAVGVLLAAIGAGVYVSRRLLRPVESFLETIHHMQQGHMDARFAYSRDNELGKIAIAFNRLMDNIRQRTSILQVTTDALQRSKQQLETLAHTIPGGLYRREPGEDGGFVFYSDGFLHIWGYTRNSFSHSERNRFSCLVHPQDRGLTSQSIQRQLAASRSFEVEYRIVATDSGERWVLDKGELTTDKSTGKRWIEGIVTDISDQKEVQRHLASALSALRRSTERLKISEQRFRLIVEQTNDIVFEWNAAGNTLYVAASFEKHFGYAPRVDRGFRDLLRTTNIHPEDRHAYRRWIRNIRHSRHVPPADFRVRTAGGSYVWTRHSATALQDASGRVARVVGVLSDVHAAKLRELELIDKAERDPLSHVYNRATFEEKAEAVLAAARTEHTIPSFIFIDIDDFRSYNTDYGHAFGDRVIAFVGQALHNAAQGFGFVGRRGGDEFVVCITGSATPKRLEDIAAEIQRALKSGLAARECSNVPISCSMGIVCVKNTSLPLEELLHQADTAMYSVKQGGKGDYRIITI